jgi:FtsZ-binding cell division protein ZapB
MPPKNKKEISEEDNGSMIEMMRAMQSQLSGQLSGLSEKIEKMDSRFDVIDRDVHDVKVILNDLKTENRQLKSEVKAMDKKLQDMDERNNALENRINQLEQHHRGWSARVLNVPLSPEEESDNFSVITKVYDLVLLPILQGALERKMLRYIPKADQLLEVAHVLPGKAGEPKPIIMRFYNRDIKDTIFKLKKYYAPRMEQSGPRGGGGGGAAMGGGAGGDQEPGGFEGRGKFCFPLYEDLTRATFLKMRTISKDERVKSCWTVKGQIKFVLHKNTKEVKRVVSLLDPLDIILSE